MRPHSFLTLLAPATTFAASIHLPRDADLGPATSLPSGWQYAGCAVDKVTPRSLSSAFIYSNTNTAASCIAFCSAKGYSVAGTEYGAECYCGATLPSPAPLEKDCNMPCTGDSTQACGGPSRFSLYYNPTAPAPQTNPGVGGWVSYGCVADSQKSRTLPNFTPVKGPMTVALCVEECQANKYSYGGVEYAGECWCGNEPDIKPTNDPAACFMPCVGNSSEFCGGPDAINIYGAPATTPPPDSQCQPVRADGYGLLQNGGFEGGFDGWVPNFLEGSFGADLDGTHELEGCYAAHVVPTSLPSEGNRQLSITQYISTALTPNTDYVFAGFQGRLADTLNWPSPKIAVIIGTVRLGEITACSGSDGCEIEGQGGARYTKHTVPFTYTGEGKPGEPLTFLVTWADPSDQGNADLVFDGFNLVAAPKVEEQ